MTVAELREALERVPREWDGAVVLAEDDEGGWSQVDEVRLSKETSRLFLEVPTEFRDLRG